MKSNVTAKFQWTSALLSALFLGPASAGSGAATVVAAGLFSQPANADEGNTFSSGLTTHSVVDAAESTDGHVLTLDDGQLLTSMLFVGIGTVRHGPKAQYGWVANPCEDALRPLLPAGTFALQDAPSLAQRGVMLHLG